MQIIKKYVEQMLDELESAKEYAEKYVEFKSRGQLQRAGHYREMAADELKHANFIHEWATEEVESISKVYTPPASMREKWELDNRKYVEDVAIVKQILGM
jgi:ferritin